MIKTILPSSFGFQDRLASLVDVHSRGVDSSWMSKRAAAGIFKDADIKPEKDHSFIHLIAVGDAENWGPNRNADFYQKQATTIEIPYPAKGKSKFLKIAKGNVEAHPTFITHGKVYRNHVNRNPEKSHGDIIKSAHHDIMNRVELIIKVPNATWGDELEKLASDGDVPFSISCKIPFDYCSICSNQARTRKDYCEHLKDQLGEITKEGHHIGAINDGMVYFDISKVVVPADRTAYGLLKVASSGRIIGGAELSEGLDLFPSEDLDDFMLGGMRLNKLGMLRKLSEIEKEIEATAPGKDSLAFDPDVCGDIPDADMEQLHASRDQIGNVLGALADVKISLSLSDFMKLVLGDKFNGVAGHVGDAQKMLPGIFGRLTKAPASATSNFNDLELGNDIVPRHMREMIDKLTSQHSLDDAPVDRRVTIAVLRGKSPLKMKSNEQEKSGSISMLADRMATAYAMYKVSFCQRVGSNDRVLAERVVLQNYFQ